MDSFQVFFERFKQNDPVPVKQSDVDKLENEFTIHLPSNYKDFIKRFGDTWTPDILDIIDDAEIEMNDIQQIWTVDQIISDKKEESTSQSEVDILPFANDSMGNLFVFLTSDLKTTNAKSPVYFFDHDFDTVEKICDSFTELIEQYNELT